MSPSDTAAGDLPVIVIGAGPVGLAAAARLHERGLGFLVLEAGESVGSSVRQWGHVRLFSPWRYLADASARRLLESRGWKAPDPEAHPTGSELVRELLEPLAALPEIAPGLRLRHRVTGVSRARFDRMKNGDAVVGDREASPFLVVADTPQGERRFMARAVVDASGTWTEPNPLGASGVPALGERKLRERIRYGIPDANGAERDRYAGRRTLVAGSGHSAVNAVLELARLRDRSGSGEVVWAMRRPAPGPAFGGGSTDGLPERAALGERVAALVESGAVKLVTGFRIDAIEEGGGSLIVTAGDGRTLEVDEVVATTGFRPDLGMLRELRLELDPVTEAPVRLAPLIDPNVHSCGTVPPHGSAELAHPEEGFFAVGMKSYGRAPTFLLLTGYEQVRSVVAHLAGDEAAARSVELVLPETGVCSADGGCCQVPAAAAERVATSSEPCSPTRTTAAPDLVDGLEELPALASASSGCCG